MADKSILNNFWVSFGISVLVGVVSALIFSSTRLSAFAIGFAVMREIISGIGLFQETIFVR